MTNSTIGAKYFDTMNEVRTSVVEQTSEERFSAALAESVDELSALKRLYAVNPSGVEPSGIPTGDATTKVTKWKGTDNVWHWVETPKGDLSDSAWQSLHDQRVAAAKVDYPEAS